MNGVERLELLSFSVRIECLWIKLLGGRLKTMKCEFLPCNGNDIWHPSYTFWTEGYMDVRGDRMSTGKIHLSDEPWQAGKVSPGKYCSILALDMLFWVSSYWLLLEAGRLDDSLVWISLAVLRSFWCSLGLHLSFIELEPVLDIPSVMDHNFKINKEIHAPSSRSIWMIVLEIRTCSKPKWLPTFWASLCLPGILFFLFLYCY